tara:strand:- start:811 stop:1014 length:204 start_codon:yes stop_codon:yes gene_type:complete
MGIMPNLIVRRLDDRDEIISKVEISKERASKNYVQKVMMGMLINMHEDYYIDDREFGYLYGQEETSD